MGRADSLQGAGRDCGLVGRHQTGGDGAPGSLWRTGHPLPREAEVPLASFPPWCDQGKCQGGRSSRIMQGQHRGQPGMGMAAGVSQPGLRSQSWKCGGACHQGAGGWLWQTGCWCPGERPPALAELCARAWASAAQWGPSWTAPPWERRSTGLFSTLDVLFS